MRRRDIIRSIGTAGIGSIGFASINVASAEEAPRDLVAALRESTTVQRLRDEFLFVGLRTDQAEQVDITFERDGSDSPSGFRVVHIPSRIGEVSVMVMGEYVVSLMVDVNEHGKYQMAYGYGPEPLPDPSVDEVTVAVSDDRLEVIRGVTETERAEIGDTLSKDPDDLFVYSSSLEDGYTAVEAADATVSSAAGPDAFSTGDEIEVYTVSEDRTTTIEHRTETFAEPAEQPVRTAGTGDRVAECVANSALCLGTIDACLKCKIPCMASRIPGNPTFAGFVAACLICLSHTCGHELTAVLGDEAGSCETMLCCLSDFAQYISGDRLDPDDLIEKIPAYSCA